MTPQQTPRPSPHVVIFGSLNMDLVVHVPRFPEASETLMGEAFTTAPGGKGANQAVACARLGTPTRMIGRVGDDPFGHALLEALRMQHVNTESVAVVPGSSGMAVIELEAGGQNRIIVIPGANGTLGAEDLDRLKVALNGAAALLLQLEVPLSAVVAAARLARAQGVFVMLDPAPAQELPGELYDLTDLLTPNGTEAAALVGFQVTTDDDVAKAARELLARGAREVIIKRGARGVFWANGQTARHLPAFQVEAVDTVAAGDAFNGGLAAALSQGHTLYDAIRWGQATAALSVSRAGAQSSLPTRPEVAELMTPRVPS